MTRVRAAVLALAALAVGATLLWHHVREQRASEDFPEGTDWLCADCGRGFTRSIEELGTWYRQHSTSPPCPGCGQTRTVRAHRCRHPDCRSYSTNAVTVNGKPACPKCQREW